MAGSWGRACGRRELEASQLGFPLIFRAIQGKSEDLRLRNCVPFE